MHNNNNLKTNIMKQNLKDFTLSLAFMITLTLIYLTTIYFL